MINQYVNQVKQFSRLEPTNCLEIGALDGDYSKLLAREFGLAEENIFLVEPNPVLQEGLRSRFPKSTVLPCAIAAHSGVTTMQVVDSQERDKICCSSLLTRVDGWAEELVRKPVEVNCLTGESLIKQIAAPVDLCIVDVEGLTFEVLSSFGTEIGRVRSLLIECEHSELFAGQKLYGDVAKLLGQNGFRMMAFQYAYANQSDSVWIQESFVNLEYSRFPSTWKRCLG